MVVNGKEVGISDIMRPPVLILAEATLHEALERMVREKRNSLTVVDEEGKLLGAVNAVDIIKEVMPDYLEQDEIAAGFADEGIFRENALRVKDKPVRDFMAKEVPRVTSDSSLVKAAVLAAGLGRGRITVVDSEERPVGILTRTEIKQVIAGYLGIPSS